MLYIIQYILGNNAKFLLSFLNYTLPSQFCFQGERRPQTDHPSLEVTHGTFGLSITLLWIEQIFLLRPP